MIRQILLIILVLMGKTVFPQSFSPPTEYDQKIAVADSFMQIHRYDSSLYYYRKAFDSWNGWGTEDDRYKQARAWGFEQNKDSLKKYLSYLILDEHSHYYNYIKLANDSAFNILKGTVFFKKIIKRAKIHKGKSFPSLNLSWVELLAGVYRNDQIRSELDFKNIHDIDSIRKIDSSNTVIVTSLLDKHGWLGPSIIGDQGNLTLFLVIQHSTHDVRLKYFPQLKEAIAKQNAQPSQAALMEDRILSETEGRQKYGSQLFWNKEEGRYKPFPIIDEKNVNKRRADMGMEPLEEYLKRYGIRYILPEE